MKKSLKYFILILIVVFLGWGLLKLEKSKEESEQKVNLLKQNLENIEKENKELKYKINYFSIPDNLIKEIKKQTNYKKEGEKVIIITPQESTSSAPAVSSTDSSSKKE